MTRLSKILVIAGIAAVILGLALAGHALWPRLLAWYAKPPYVTEKLIDLGLLFGIATLVGVASYVIAKKSAS